MTPKCPACGRRLRIMRESLSPSYGRVTRFYCVSCCWIWRPDVYEPFRVVMHGD